MEMQHLHLRAWNAEKGERHSRPMELQDATPLREEPSLSEELYKSARWLRVFTATRAKLDARSILDALERFG